MAVVECIRQKLEVCLKGVLALVEARVNALLNVCEFLKHIDGRLLVSFGWVLQVRQRRLELDRFIPVLKEPRGNGWVEGHGTETIIGMFCPE